jgi:5'-nucleotidase
LEQQWKDSNKPNFLQIAGFRYSWTKNPTAGKWVVEGSLKLANGDLIEMSKTYTVAVNNYLATGGDGFTVFKEAKVLKKNGPNDLDAFVNFLKEKAKTGPIKSKSLIDGRIQKL